MVKTGSTSSTQSDHSVCTSGTVYSVRVRIVGDPVFSHLVSWRLTGTMTWLATGHLTISTEQSNSW